MTIFSKFVRAGFVAAGIALSVAVVAPVGYAAKSTSLTAEDSADIDRISRYFNGFKTLAGEFVQVGPRGGISKGTFFISKPGKLRFDYMQPNPFLIVSDGTWVAIQNRKNNRIDHYPLATTPLKLVLSKQVDLRKHARIIKVIRDGNSVLVTLADKNKAVPGKLTLIFDTDANILKEWVVVDGENRRTTVSLNKLEEGGKFSPKLFVLKKRRKDDQRDASK
ncbi:MAG: LolA family protein [Hyphomicrobiales bacterium]